MFNMFNPLLDEATSFKNFCAHLLDTGIISPEELLRAKHNALGERNDIGDSGIMERLCPGIKSSRSF